MMGLGSVPRMEGKLPGVKRAKYWHVKASDLSALLDDQKTSGGQAADFHEGR
jgi:hypothetical protein